MVVGGGLYSSNAKVLCRCHDCGIENTGERCCHRYGPICVPMLGRVTREGFVGG